VDKVESPYGEDFSAGESEVSFLSDFEEEEDGFYDGDGALEGKKLIFQFQNRCLKNDFPVLFVCGLCDENRNNSFLVLKNVDLFKNKEDVLKHIKSQHCKNSGDIREHATGYLVKYQCSRCLKTFTDKDSYDQHFQ